MKTLSATTRAKQFGKGSILATAIAALSLTAIPVTAHAGNGIGTGAAIANSVPPAYAAPPPPAYDYPPQPNQGYYAPAPAYYQADQPYYGWTPYR